MHYITVAEFESPGTVTCKVQGLSAPMATDIVNLLKTMDLKYSSEVHLFEVDTQGVDVLNILSNPNFKVISQSTVIEVSNIGSRTDKVQKTIWTLGKNSEPVIVQ